jgi:hypothetical protein
VRLVGFTSRRERERAHWPTEAPGTAPAAGHRRPAAPAEFAAQVPGGVDAGQLTAPAAAGALGQVGDPQVSS